MCNAKSSVLLDFHGSSDRATFICPLSNPPQECAMDLVCNGNSMHIMQFICVSWAVLLSHSLSWNFGPHTCAPTSRYWMLRACAASSRPSFAHRDLSLPLVPCRFSKRKPTRFPPFGHFDHLGHPTTSHGPLLLSINRVS